MQLYRWLGQGKMMALRMNDWRTRSSGITLYIYLNVFNKYNAKKKKKKKTFEFTNAVDSEGVAHKELHCLGLHTATLGQ